MPTTTYKAFVAACALVAALFVGQMPAHAGGLLNSLGNMGAVVNGMDNYNNPYYQPQYPSLQQQLYDQQLLAQQELMLRQQQNGLRTYTFPNGRTLYCTTIGFSTTCQ